MKIIFLIYPRSRYYCRFTLVCLAVPLLPVPSLPAGVGVEIHNNLWIRVAPRRAKLSEAQSDLARVVSAAPCDRHWRRGQNVGESGTRQTLGDLRLAHFDSEDALQAICLPVPLSLVRWTNPSLNLSYYGYPGLNRGMWPTGGQEGVHAHVKTRRQRIRR